MLLPRILSAIVMAVLFVYAVFVLNAAHFIFAMAGVVVLAGWEWARLSGVRNQVGRIAFAVFIGVLCLSILNLNIHEMSLYLSLNFMGGCLVLGNEISSASFLAAYL
ncbi:phosphatidate cytidylyltransferase [Marinomonas rhodophyticola]|uniref:Phosphatidate cytidylyltransferase n=1 Tax=Marinomonas rhodophyticola TaxID=2992803 RepID=A0ABT3KLD8_9GAMM|nr:phosphatidate cytidylyltransferase [Marinomonas sp. KJ51-3]MCW4631361.1 phosphatidate cytidylyltransferase [Marinomonas sp. KJ51-3]